MQIAIIDNYDSFTYNLKHMITELGAEVSIFKNDRLELSQLNRFDKLVLSPGPGIPSEAGRLEDVIRHYSSRKPILGVCLGEQAIAEVFGAKLINLPSVYHGIQSQLIIQGTDSLFDGISTPIDVGRYHSWVVDKEDFPPCLELTATCTEGHIMAFKHKTYDVHGIQFHPESILTPHGKKMMANFLYTSENTLTDEML